MNTTNSKLPEEEARERREYLCHEEHVVKEQVRQQQHTHSRLHSNEHAGESKGLLQTTTWLYVPLG